MKRIILKGTVELIGCDIEEIRRDEIPTWTNLRRTSRITATITIWQENPSLQPPKMVSNNLRQRSYELPLILNLFTFEDFVAYFRLV